MKSKTKFALVALALVCAMLGGYVGSSLIGNATAENGAAGETVIVTSPFTQAVQDVRGSVVGVNNYQLVRYNNYGYGWGRGGETTQEVKAASGSGVVVAEGYVLTNYHVVEGASTVKVAVQDENGENMREYDCTVAVYDRDLDVAVLHCPDLDLPPVKLGDSDKLLVGDWAICIGNPISDEFYGTVTVGVVSALNRSISTSSMDRYGRRTSVTNTMIQVDAEINSGNSGGGMFSVTGELMGIPTLKYTSTSSYFFSGAPVDGINMCIPINVAKPLIEEAVNGTAQSAQNDANGDPEDAQETLLGKPRLGITIAGLNPASYPIQMGLIPYGVYVSQVDENSPAEEAGMLQGDIIVEIDGRVVNTTSQLQAAVAAHAAGDTVSIRVYRAEGMADAVENGADVPENGDYVDLTVTLRVIDTVKQ